LIQRCVAWTVPRPSVAFSIVVSLRFHNGRKLIPSSGGECLMLNNRGAFVRLLRRGAGRLSEQPAGTLAQGAKLAAGLNDQERVVWNRPTGGVAAFATTDRKPHQNFPFPKAHRTRTVFLRFTCTEPASLWRIRGHFRPEPLRRLQHTPKCDWNGPLRPLRVVGPWLRLSVAYYLLTGGDLRESESVPLWSYDQDLTRVLVRPARLELATF